MERRNERIEGMERPVRVAVRVNRDDHEQEQFGVEPHGPPPPSSWQRVVARYRYSPSVSHGDATSAMADAVSPLAESVKGYTDSYPRLHFALEFLFDAALCHARRFRVYADV
jgi:hypothetical protein